MSGLSKYFFVPILTAAYMKDPNDKNKWNVDDGAAKVVQYIFSLCIEGYGPTQIAKRLTSEKVLIPTAYWQSQGRITNNRVPDNPCVWVSDTVARILSKKEYLGHTVNFKTFRKSYKDKKKRNNPEENQLVFENTHPAIIEKEQWELVQELRKHKRRPTKTGKKSLFSGLLYCADCNAKLYFCTTNSFTPNQDHFVCSNYKSNTGNCSIHFIRDVTLYDIVLYDLRNITAFVRKHEKAFIQQMMEKDKASKNQN